MAGVTGLRIVLRSPDQLDVVFRADSDAGYLEVVEYGPGVGDAVVCTDSAHRLLVIWGRRSARRPLSIEADPAQWEAVAAVLWPDIASSRFRT